MNRRSDIAVIGGGLVGKSLAWGFAQSGVSTTVFDANDDRFHASAGNFGLVWVQGKGLTEPAYSGLTLRSARAWSSFSEDLRSACGIATQLQQTGGIKFALTDEEMERYDNELQRQHNQPTQYRSETKLLDRSELLELIPEIGPEVRGGTYCPLDGQADPLATLSALSQALLISPNFEIVRHSVTNLAASEGGGFSIETPAGYYKADRIVLAAGLGNSRLAPMVGLSAPVRPIRGQIAITERMPAFLNLACHTIRQTQDGTVMMGDSKEDVGWNIGVTRPVSQAIVERAVRCFPHLASARIVRTWSALRVMSPDGLPIYQESTKYPGASLVTCHSGVTLAAAHAGEVAEAILDGRLNSTYPQFSPSRLRLAA